MEDFEFDLNVFIEIGLKYESTRFDKMPKAQVLELRDAILDQTSEIIDYYCNLEDHAFKVAFPILVTGEKGLYQITAGLLFINNSIECVNIPTCIEEGVNYRNAFSKIIVSIIECLDVRIRRKMNLTENIIADPYYKSYDSISSAEFVKNLEAEGWTDSEKMPFHTILLKKNCPITFSIPNDENISKALRFAFERYLYFHDGDTNFWD